MTTPLPPWQGYVEFVANPPGGAPAAPSFLLQEDGVSFVLQEDGVSKIILG